MADAPHLWLQQVDETGRHAANRIQTLVRERGAHASGFQAEISAWAAVTTSFQPTGRLSLSCRVTPARSFDDRLRMAEPVRGSSQMVP